QTVLPNFTALLTGAFAPPEAPPQISVGIASSGTASQQGRVELDPTFQQPIYVVPSEAQRPRLVRQMILQDVVVLKLGNFIREAPTSTDPNAAPAPSQELANPDIVTLMVNPQDSI